MAQRSEKIHVFVRCKREEMCRHLETTTTSRYKALMRAKLLWVTSNQLEPVAQFILPHVYCKHFVCNLLISLLSMIKTSKRLIASPSGLLINREQ